MHATLGTSMVVFLALAVSSIPVVEEEQQKWYELEGSEFQAVAKQIKKIGNLENFDADGILSITFGRFPATFITNDDGTYLFDVYRMTGPTKITHVLLSPARGSPKAPPPPFLHPPSKVISSREALASADTSYPPLVFPANVKSYKGSPVYYILEAVGKAHIRITDVKKFMAHRDLP